MKPDPEELRVLTRNLWWRFGPWRERQVAIEAVLAEVDADLIGLQEVWSAPDRNFAASLADGLGLHCVWRPSPAQEHWQRRLGDDGVEIGNAMLSRWPIVNTEHLTLTASAAADRRTILYASVEAPFGMVDAWRYCDDPASGVTWDRRNPFVPATHEPSVRIDHVLAGMHARAGRPRACAHGDARGGCAGLWPLALRPCRRTGRARHMTQESVARPRASDSRSSEELTPVARSLGVDMTDIV